MALPDIPVYKQKETIKEQPTPDFQSAYQELAESKNLLGTIGAQVAQSASNTMAAQLGYEAGKKPHGDLTPSLTEFDKNFAQSYNNQAHAILSLQGQKLLDDAYINLGKAPKLTPDLIASTNRQVQQGLNRISENAPTAVKGQLQSNFDSKLLQQTTQYNEKMIGQQRQEQRDVVTNAIDVNLKNMFDIAKNGDITNATKQAIQTKKLADNAYDNRLISLEQKTTAYENADQLVINGSYINQALTAYHNGTIAKFEKDFADNKLPGMEKLTNQQRDKAGNAIYQQIKYQNALTSLDENITAAQMDNKIAINPGLITDQEWLEFKNQVSPLKYEQVKLKYIQALKKKTQDTTARDTLIKNWSNSEAHSYADPKVQKEAFTTLVDETEKKYKLSHDAAQVAVAAHAGAKVNIFTDILKDKLNSGNPAQMDSAALQIHELEEIGAGHALDGLNDKDKALNAMYKANRSAKDPVTAAQETINNIKNTDSDVQKLVRQKLANKLWVENKGGTSAADFALNEAGLDAGSFINPTVAQVYGTNILGVYSSYYELFKSDENLTKQQVKKFVEQKYGETRINGGTDITYQPIEKTLGYSDHAAVPFIQQDVVKQFNEHIIPLKAAFDKKESNEYWEAVPVSNQAHGIFTTTYDPVKLTRHQRTDQGEKVDTFNVILQGNAFNSWDVAIQTDSGMRNLFEFAPFLGIMTYSPNQQAIKDAYLGNKPITQIPPEGQKGNGLLSKTVEAVGNFLVSTAESRENPEGREPFIEAHEIARTGVSGINKPHELPGQEEISKTPEIPEIKKDLLQMSDIPNLPEQTEINEEFARRFDFLKLEEGRIKKRGQPKLKAYQDTKGNWTIGWGHTQGVKKGDKITFDQAIHFLIQDIKPLLKEIKNQPMNFTENQIVALISFGHHEGPGALNHILDFISTNPTEKELREKFNDYTRSGKEKYYKPFVNRRKREMDLYYQPVEEYS